MPETRHRTVIEIGVDDRQIRGLDQTMRSAFDERILGAFERTLEQSTRSMERMLRVTERLEQLMRRMPGMPRGDGGGPGGGPGGGGGGTGGDMASLARSIDRLASSTQQTASAMRQGGGRGGGAGFGTIMGGTAMGSYLGNLGRGVGGGGFLQAAASGVPWVGPAIAGAAGQIQSLYGAYSSQQQGIAPSMGMMGAQRALGGMTQYGLTRAAAASQMAQYTQASGIQVPEFDKPLLREALRAQFYGGIQGGGLDIIGAQQTGAGVNRAAPGAMPDFRAPGEVTFGGGGGLRGLLQQAIGYGLSSGVRPARLGQFTGNVAQMTQQQHLSGGQMDARVPMMLTQALSSLQAPSGGVSGFGGDAGVQAAQNVVSTTSQFQPGMDAQSMIMLRAAGFGVDPGVTFHQAIRRIQGDDPEYPLTRVMERAQEIMQGMGGGAGTSGSTEIFRQLGPSMFGIGNRITQAEALSSGALSAGAIPQERAEEVGGRFLDQRQRRLRRGYRVPAVEAQYQNERADTGAEVSAVAVSARRFELEITQAVVVPLANAVRSIVTDMVDFTRAYLRGGLSELLSTVAEGESRSSANPPNVSQQQRDIADYLERTQGRGPADRYRRQTGEDIAPYRGVRGEGETARGEQVGGGKSASEQTYGGEPTSDAADALRRMQRDAGIAADAIERTGLIGEGELAYG